MIFTTCARQAAQLQLCVMARIDEQRLVRPQHDVLAHDDADRIAGADGECRLHIEVASRQFLSDLVDAVLNALPRRHDHLTLAVAPIGRRELRRDADQRRQLAPPSSWRQCRSTPSSSPALPAASTPGRRSRVSDDASGKIRRFHTSSTRRWPNAT